MVLKEILTGVDEAVKAARPGEPVYWNRKPKDFVRPSHLLEGGPVVSTEMGGGQERVTVQVRLTSFTKVDAYGHSGTDDLLDEMEALRVLFRGGYIQIGGRAPHVTEVSGDYGLDYAEVTAKLEFYEISTSRRVKENVQDLMRSFHTKVSS